MRPDVWGTQARIRLSNAFGTKPVTFDDAFVGLQESGSAVVKGTNQPVLFAGQKSVTVRAGPERGERCGGTAVRQTPRPTRCSRAASSRSASMSWAKAAR